MMYIICKTFLSFNSFTHIISFSYWTEYTQNKEDICTLWNVFFYYFSGLEQGKNMFPREKSQLCVLQNTGSIRERLLLENLNFLCGIFYFYNPPTIEFKTFETFFSTFC